MLLTKSFLRAAVVIAALAVNIPSVVLAQTNQDASVCKRTYRACINGKDLRDFNAKEPCARDYRNCLVSASDAAKANFNAIKTTQKDNVPAATAKNNP